MCLTLCSHQATYFFDRLSLSKLFDDHRFLSFACGLTCLQAQTLHVCGDPGALPLLRQLVNECGDILEVRACFGGMGKDKQFLIFGCTA